MKRVKFVPAKRTAVDAKLVMEWRNDPRTLTMFYHSEPKKWPDFLKEYRRDYFRHKGLDPCFAVSGGQKAAFLRFSPYRELRGRAADVDINVKPSMRGRGLGARVLKEAARRLFSKGFTAVVGEIKVENRASVNAFRKAGFSRLDRRVKHVKDIRKKFRIVRMIAYAHDEK